MHAWSLIYLCNLRYVRSLGLSKACLDACLEADSFVICGMSDLLAARRSGAHLRASTPWTSTCPRERSWDTRDVVRGKFVILWSRRCYYSGTHYGAFIIFLSFYMFVILMIFWPAYIVLYKASYRHHRAYRFDLVIPTGCFTKNSELLLLIMSWLSSLAFLHARHALAQHPLPN